jgi:hypothetical protein
MEPWAKEMSCEFWHLNVDTVGKARLPSVVRFASLKEASTSYNIASTYSDVHYLVSYYILYTLNLR